MLSFRVRVPALLAASVVLAAGAAGCGGEERHGQGAIPHGKPTERAFLEAMVPHHRSAVEMAEVAQERAKAPEIRRLAGHIIDSQKGEIVEMGRLHQRLFGTELRPNEGAHTALGLSAEDAGMGHMKAARALRRADPFYRAFVDEMVPHHQGAIRMAEAVLPRTGDAELRKLAGDIVSAQEREIAEMNAFRRQRYGAPVPARRGHAGEKPEPMGHSGGH
jgi:uncharacterized protein (DUF305 family)